MFDHNFSDGIGQVELECTQIVFDCIELDSQIRLVFIIKCFGIAFTLVTASFNKNNESKTYADSPIYHFKTFIITVNFDVNCRRLIATLCSHHGL